jgi:hypothetical protein
MILIMIKIIIIMIIIIIIIIMINVISIIIISAETFQIPSSIMLNSAAADVDTQWTLSGHSVDTQWTLSGHSSGHSQNTAHSEET